MVLDRAAAEISGDGQGYDLNANINALRRQLDAWRQLPPQQWRVTPQTARLLQHWRHHPFSGIRPFFCQVEAAETVIWLTEVAPRLGREARNILTHLQNANDGANPGLSRLALKLATGTGKTTVMAMLIAWQTVNAVRHPGSRRFTRGFLVVTPGVTVRERLRVLQPNDPDSYYQARELVPQDMLPDLQRAAIVIANYHAFIRREDMALARGSRMLLQGHGPAPANPGDGRPDAAAGAAGTDGHEAHPGVQRRRPPLLPRTPCGGSRGKRSQGRGTRRSQAQSRSGPGVDLRLGGRPCEAGPKPRDRSLRHAVLPARLRLRGRHAVPVDGVRFLADGRHRVRHRQAASRTSGGQRSQRGNARLPQPLGAHRQGHAEEGPSRQRRRSEPVGSAGAAANRSRRVVRALRARVRRVAAREDRRAAVLHRRLQQHGPPPSWSTTTSPASIGSARTVRKNRYSAASNCSATSTKTATPIRARARC